MKQIAPASEHALAYLRRLVHGTSAIVLDKSKDYLFQARLSPIISDEGFADFDDLVAHVEQDKLLAQRVVEAMTTNETSFFRDLHPFEALRKVILPELAAASRPQKSLTIWSAASSTGQELYSIAFLMKELAGRFAGWPVRLIGTDLSTEVLAKARAGRYSQLEVNRGLPISMLLKHFDKIGTDWQVKDDIRRMTEFRRLNLIEPWPSMPKFDIVFLRNVLIYFDVATRRLILNRVSANINPGGYLFLGGVETSMNLTGRLSIVHLDKTICYRALPEGDKNARANSA